MKAVEELRAEDFLSGRKRISKPDENIYKEIRERWDCAAKPLDSLGKFEDITARIGAICGSANIDIKKKTVIVFCADNGIVDEGVSQCGQEVTLAVAKAMGMRKSSVCKMAAKAGVAIKVLDIGINAEERVEDLEYKRIRKGTRNFVLEPAMTKEELIDAVQVGIDAAAKAHAEGNKIICLGEMGIGNTTTSSAVVAALTKKKACKTTGRGAGLSDDGLEKKISVIDNAIKKYDLYNADAPTVLRCVGGLDIAGMVGAIFGAAERGVPVILDGIVSCAAALCAAQIQPNAREYMIASHNSREASAVLALNELGLSPVIDADLALGEGTGAVMLCSLLDIALTLYDNTLTFEDIEIDKYTRFT